MSKTRKQVHRPLLDSKGSDFLHEPNSGDTKYGYHLLESSTQKVEFPVFLASYTMAKEARPYGKSMILRILPSGQKEGQNTKRILMVPLLSQFLLKATSTRHKQMQWDS